MLLELPRRKHALVHHQHIDRTGFFDRLRNGVVVADVGGERGDLDSGGELDRFFGFLELFSGASEDGDASSFRGGAVSESETDAAGSAGDEDVAGLDGDSDGFGAYD
ncbi:Uncharacterized protein Rs2_19788 [Raphanus sativus]|nr:Uncharacterized protein Rs2_19788 [Raphanus sativus]